MENYRMVARTASIEEANQVCEQYQMRGFKTKIIKKKQGNLSLYEVWATKSEHHLM